MCRGLFICLERTVRSSRPGREALVVCGAQAEGGCGYCTYIGGIGPLCRHPRALWSPRLLAGQDYYVPGAFYMSREDRAQF